MARRHPVGLAVGAAGCLLALVAAPSVASTTDRTGPNGRLGVTTVGMGGGAAYAEPSLAWASDGRHGLICTPGPGANDKRDGLHRTSSVQLWRTADAGRTWQHSQATSLNGGGDCDVDILPDGTAVLADLETGDAEIQESTDWGRTWTTVGRMGQNPDRQWLAHSSDGSRIYLVYHDFVSEAEWYATAGYDRRTRRITIAPQDCCHSAQSAEQVTAPGFVRTQLTPVGPGSSASMVDQTPNTFSGPLLLDPSDPTGRTMAVVYTIADVQSNANPNDGIPPYDPRGIVVASTRDGGTSWSSHYAAVAGPQPNGAAEPLMGALFPWGAFDRAGTLYVVYNSTIGQPGDHFRQFYVYSTDKGAHWSRPTQLDRLPQGMGAAVFATADASGKGRLAVAWYQSDNGTPSSTTTTVTWVPHLAVLTHADSAHPRVDEQSVTALPSHRGGICLNGLTCLLPNTTGSQDRSLLDYFQLTINPRTGMAGIAYSDNGGARPHEGTGEVVFALQTKASETP